MNLLTCIMRNSRCYLGTTKGRPVGILWHDTGAGNPNISRYVQPDPDDPKRSELLKLIGKNPNGNDWNHPNTEQKGVNAFVGKLADGSLGAVQVLPWDYRPWGCGGGDKGSCNGDPDVSNSPFWIQFEICDDFYKSKEYFKKAYMKAVELTAYLCKLYGIDPKGTVKYNGVTVPTILCHWDSYKLGLGSGHGDVYDWFAAMGEARSMEKVRKDVAKAMEEETEDEMTKAELDAILKKEREERDKAINKALDEALGPMIKNYDEIPWESVKNEVREMVEMKVIDGGTDEAVNPNDVNMRLQLLRVLVVGKRFSVKAIAKSIADKFKSIFQK